VLLQENNNTVQFSNTRKFVLQFLVVSGPAALLSVCAIVTLVVSLEIYYGALRIVRRTLDLKLWMRWMLADLPEPHNSNIGTVYLQFVRRKEFR
jgi:hypothetical protein